MKIVQALKKIKDNNVKIDDLKEKIAQHCADMENESPVYKDEATQKNTVAGWLQSIHDLIVENEKLDYQIKKTNLATNVTILLGGKEVTKPITSWIKRRQSLAQMEMLAWQSLKDERNGRRLVDEVSMDQKSGSKTVNKVRRYYDPQTRDVNVSIFKSEPSIIDGTLEVKNAETDLLE